MAHARRGLSLHRETGYRLGEARALHLLATSLEDDDADGSATARADAATLLAAIGAPPEDLALEPAGFRAG